MTSYIQAIATSPEERLTLNDIYDWMISAIPYFSDRQDNASSAGWKVEEDVYLIQFNSQELNFRTLFATIYHCIKNSSRSQMKMLANPPGGGSTLA